MWRKLDRQKAYNKYQVLTVVNIFNLMSSYHRMSLDSGMIVVIMISLMYMVLVFGLLFYVKNDWCDLLFKNFTVNFQ